MDFLFLMVPKVKFKSGAINEIGSYVEGFGKKFFIITSKRWKEKGLLSIIEAQLEKYKIEYEYYFDIIGEPVVEDVDNAYKKAKKENCDVVLALGGGSIMDVGKAVAALITNGKSVKDYLEFVGTDAKIINDPVPFIAIPTTSGTGSEVTKNSVIGSKKENFKRSIRDDRMLADLVIIDPSLTIGLPKSITASSGIDALTHCMEVYTTIRNPNPISKALAFEGIKYAGKCLEKAYDVPDNIKAREGMALSALYGGMALANSGLGAAHGLGMVLNIYCDISHGEAVGILLPYVMEINANKFPELYDKVGEVLTGKSFDKKGEGTIAAIEFIKALNEKIGIPKDLKRLNISSKLAIKMGEECFGSSMSGNPVQLTKKECAALFMKLS